MKIMLGFRLFCVSSRDRLPFPELMLSWGLCRGWAGCQDKEKHTCQWVQQALHLATQHSPKPASLLPILLNAYNSPCLQTLYINMNIRTQRSVHKHLQMFEQAKNYMNRLITKTQKNKRKKMKRISVCNCL